MIEIAKETDGSINAVSGDITVNVRPDGETKAFNRRAIRLHFGKRETEHLECLVCKLDDVFIYIKGNSIVMTKQDLNH